MKEIQVFETERLLIKPTSVEDAPFIFELLNTPKWKKFIGKRNINSIQDAEDYIKNKMLPQLAKLGFSNNTITRTSDGVKIGTCGLYDREGIDGVDIGFAFLPEYEKLGYAFESTSELLKIASLKFNLDKVNAITLQENTASQNLLKKLGFSFQRIVTIPNDDTDLLLFSINL